LCGKIYGFVAKGAVIVGKTEDLRIRRTHKLLVDAMFSLIDKKGFDDISVSEICERAMVHRATFYKHFEDKYRFFEFCIERKLDELFPSLTDEKLLGTKEYFMGIVEKVLDFLDANRKVVRQIFNATNSNTITDAIQNAVRLEIGKKLSESEAAGVKYRLPVHILGEYYTGALIALAKWWILSGTKLTKEEMAGYIDVLVDEGVCLKPGALLPPPCEA